MKKAALFLFSLLLLTGAIKALEEIQVGSVNIPREFIHEGKEYPKGVYKMILTEKDGVPVFLVNSKENELLFEEIAVIKPYEGKTKNFKHRINKAVLKDYEYFRVKVSTPASLYMAYFLLKK